MKCRNSNSLSLRLIRLSHTPEMCADPRQPSRPPLLPKKSLTLIYTTTHSFVRPNATTSPAKMPKSSTWKRNWSLRRVERKSKTTWKARTRLCRSNWKLLTALQTRCSMSMNNRPSWSSNKPNRYQTSMMKKGFWLSSWRTWMAYAKVTRNRCWSKVSTRTL